MKVYVVVAEYDCYEDHGHWVVKAFFDRDAAEGLVRMCNEWWRSKRQTKKDQAKMRVAHKRAWEAIKNPNDPCAPIGVDPDRYVIYETELE